MSSSSEIPRHLAALRRRIRKLQWTRGILKILFCFFAGLIIIAALDYFLAPLGKTIRLLLFAVWMISLCWTAFRFLFLPLKQKITDVKLARWLERRHPEVQERISTALELSNVKSGISPALLKELSLEAMDDISAIDPKMEISTKKLRSSLLPLSALLGLLLLSVVIFPQEVSRLLQRAISPFSDSGNAGAFRFTFDPGNLEVFEGDEILINLTYEGSDELRLFTKTESGEIFDEAIVPASQDGDTSEFEYRLHRADSSFEYYARAGAAESDHFDVTVYPKPRLENASVRYQFPEYTGWSEQVAGLTNGVKVIAGTKITIKSRVPIGVEEASLSLDGESSGKVEISESANGNDLAWSHQPKQPGQFQARIVLNHRIKSDLELGRFPVEIEADTPPVIELIEPTRRELRLNPEDQVIFTYEVIEQIGLSRAEVELQVDGEAQPALKEVLPKRIEQDQQNRWEGEAMVYLGSLVDQFPKAREFRLRMKISDNRTEEFSGPVLGDGVGHSEWVSVRIDKNADFLASQELKAQQKNIRASIEEAIRDTRKAQNKMEQAKHQLQKEELPKHIEKRIAEARDEFAEVKKNLEELAERMEKSVQAHRSDEVIAIAEKIAEAQRNAEFTPLQDNEEARRSEAEAALQNSREAVKALEELRNEIDRDRHKVEDLARLQELAQKQDALARQVEAESSEAPDKKWQQQQERVKNELREMVKQSPQAKAAALEAQAERAEELSSEARELSEAQADLKDLAASQETTSEKIAEALKQEQAQVAAEAKKELLEAQQKNEPRAESLPEAVAQSEQASQASTLEQAAESAKKAAEAFAENEESAPSQQSLQDRQEQLAEAFDALANAEPEKAIAKLEEIQAEQIGEALQQEQAKIVFETEEELAEARANNEERANSLPEAVAQAEQASEASTPEAAAESAQKAAEALKEGEESVPSQQALQDRQEQVAEAFDALAKGDTQEALFHLEEMQAEQTAELAQELRDFNSAEFSQPINEAQNKAQDGANRADQAMKQQANGQSQQAAQFHQQSSQSLEQAAQKLEQAAKQFSAQSEQAAQQQPNQNKAPAPGEPLAEAFNESAEAAQADSGEEAAQSAQAAAQALKQAAQEAKSAMAQNRQSGQKNQGEPMAQNRPSQPGESDQQGTEGDKPNEKPPREQADPGVPPELARLGVSAADWEKIRATLKSDIGGSSGAVVPEDYRGLVKKYFEQVTGK